MRIKCNQFNPKAVAELTRQLPLCTVNKEAVFCGPYENTQEILPGEFGITTSNDPKNILATYGLGPCISILGIGEIICPTSKEPLTIGFLSHYTPCTNIDEAFGILLYHLSKLTERQKVCFESRIVVGRRRFSEKQIEQLRRKLVVPLRKDITFNLVEEKEGNIAGRKSIDAVLDLKNRQVYYSYDPLQNPFSRELPKSIMMDMMEMVERPSSLVYFPSNLQ